MGQIAVQANAGYPTLMLGACHKIHGGVCCILRSQTYVQAVVVMSSSTMSKRHYFEIPYHDPKSNHLAGPVMCFAGLSLSFPPSLALVVVAFSLCRRP